MLLVGVAWGIIKSLNEVIGYTCGMMNTENNANN